jgi:nicotinate-nucleotide adenylyltransferase
MNESDKDSIGILGGSFDPVHLGHLKLAQAAVETGCVNEVIFVPAAQAPLRDEGVRASPAHRAEMLKIALESFKYKNEVCLFEIRRGGISYTVDTAEFLRRQYPQKKLKWIIGADHIAKLPQWKNIGRLAEIVSFICGARENFNADTSILSDNIKVEFFKFKPIPHSSTLIREYLKNGKRNLNMLDPKVENYIFKHKLYNT